MSTELGRIFTTQEARAAGLSPRELGSDRYQRLFRGAYMSRRQPPDLRERVTFALSQVDPACFASHHTAAELLHASVPSASDMHLGIRRRTKSTKEGIRLHFFTHGPKTTLAQGIPSTAPEQTFLDMAPILEFIDLLILGDSLVRRTWATADSLARFVANTSVNGARRAREVAPFVRHSVDSPNETRLRLLIMTAGLPEPVVNFELVERDGQTRRRLDLAYPSLRLAVEFDGRHHIERRGQWQQDLHRREELESAGWRLIVVTSSDLYADPLGLLMRIADAIQLAGAPRPQLRDGWHRHFARA
jgi:very-short-patch-repair endonuclease